MKSTGFVVFAGALAMTLASAASASTWVISSGNDCSSTCATRGGGVWVAKSPVSDGTTFGDRWNFVCGAWLQGASEWEWTPGQNWGAKVNENTSADKCCAGWKGTEECTGVFECLCNN